jgi:uncharacterized protein
MNIELHDNQDEDRYEIRVDGQLAGFAQYRPGPEKISFLHTEIDPEHEGGGLGSRLIRFALEDARSRGLSVVPICPFVTAMIERHPNEYLDLVVPAMRGRVSGDP